MKRLDHVNTCGHLPCKVSRVNEPTTTIRFCLVKYVSVIMLLLPLKWTEGDTLGVHFFTVLLHMHWQFLLGTSAMGMVCHYFATIHNLCLASLQWLNQTKQTNKQKHQTQNKKAKWQDPTLCHYFPLGVCIFFWFLGFLFLFFFLVFGSLLVHVKKTLKLTVLGQTLKLTHFKILWIIPLKKEWCISLKWLLPSTSAFLFKW